MGSMPPKFVIGEPITGYAAAADIVGGRFVKVTGNKTADGDYPIGHCGAGEASQGVSHADAFYALPTTAHARRAPFSQLGVGRVETGGSITALDLVQADAAGKAVTHTTGVPLGIALHTAGNASVVEVMLFGPRALSAAAIVSLTDSSGGTPNDTVAALPVLTDSPATADALRDDIVTNLVPVLANNFADLTAKVNAILAALRAGGSIAP